MIHGYWLGMRTGLVIIAEHVIEFQKRMARKQWISQEILEEVENEMAKFSEFSIMSNFILRILQYFFVNCPNFVFGI